MYYIFAFKHQLGLNRSEKSGQQLAVRFAIAEDLGDGSSHLTEPKNKISSALLFKGKGGDEIKNSNHVVVRPIQNLFDQFTDLIGKGR